MKKKVFGPVGVLCLSLVSLSSPVLAAELLDVKPLVVGSNVAIEVTADIPMTYTYYKVPGQARAVVDIADADPEKVEPLIVVNKGAVASISVDKAMIGDMTVSRLVFNLVSESDISVSQAPDRKTLTVSFGSGTSVAAPPAATPAEPVAVPMSKEPVVPVSAVVAEPKEPVVAAVPVPSHPLSKEEADPLGLDEPQSAAVADKEAVPATVYSAKLEPVVPATVDQESPTVVAVKGIVLGASFIDIQTNGSVEKFKQLRLAKPERLSIEIPGTSSMKVASVQVKRFGIQKVRIGTTPGFVRVVLDASKSSFPRYDIVSIENGLRITFK
jgi:AMIN domain